MKRPIETNHDAWLQKQRMKIGGSDIPTLLGISGSTLMDLWLFKTARGTGFTGNDLTYIGIHSEDLVAANFMEQYPGVKAWQDNFVRFSEVVPVLGVNLDRRILRHPRFGMKPGVMQIKTTSANAWDASLDKFPKPELNIPINYDKINGTPFKYICQLLMEMHCAKVEFGFLSAYVTGDFTRRFEHNIFYTKDWLPTIDALLNLVDSFWKNYVETDTPPPTETLEDLANFHPVITSDLPGIVTEELRKKMEQLKEKKAARDEYEALKKEIEIDVKSLIGNGELLLCESGEKILAKWGQSTSWKFDEKKFKIDHPEMHSDYSTQKVTRRFNPKY